MKSKYILIFVIFLSISCKNSNKLASSDTNLENVNSLFFSKNDVTKSKPTKKDFTTNFTLNKDQFLNIHFTLEKPLIAYLHPLSPNLTQEQLLEYGSFQYSFSVDGKVIYIENLNKGAGLKITKTEQLKHTVRLITPKQIDYWGWFMWLKFIKIGGGQDVLTEGNHTLTIEIRPYIKQDKLKIGEILAKGNLSVKVPKIKIDESLIPIQKIEPNSDWELSKDNYNKPKIEALNRKIAEKRFEDINGIVVIKDNKLLIEEYFNGENRNSLHDPRSVGKSIASTLLGIAIKENFIKDENQFLKDYYNLKSFKNYSPKKDKVTLKHLLTMSSSFTGDDSNYNSLGNEENMYPTKNWVKFSLDLPMNREKELGTDFTYFTAGVVVLGDIIHKSVPEGLVSYADKKLFKPLNITNYKWQFTPQKVGNTAGGLQLRALDFAKYGQLYKNKGFWNGKQILNKEWVEKSLDKKVNISSNEFYGYLFWNKTYKINNKEYEVSYCSGRGGNKIFIFKDIPFVVVITSSAYNVPNAHANTDKIMADYILPAIINN